MENHVPLERQFSPVPRTQEDAEKDEILSAWGYAEPKTWEAICHEYRCIILAEAGAGKTEEFRQQARVLAAQGKPAFFIRIEDIAADFYKAFEIGDDTQYHAWLQSTEEAWFFLDSVDEARLDNPRTFENSLRRFARAIKNGAHRAHIYLSSRPYAWRPREDRRLLEEILFFAAPQKDEQGKDDHRLEPQSALTIFTLRPLDTERARQFCVAREAKDVDRLLHEIERANLWSLAERPFDLEGILSKWSEDGILGGRLELLRHNIDKRLRDDHNSDRAQRQPLNLEQARQGARRLAAAVLLSGQAGLNVPSADQVKPGIESESVLSDWDPKNVGALLGRAIFNDVIYGAVRFRHREVRELLAAEWFDELLKTGSSRHSVESLLFREQYGEKIISPRLRPIFPWLILFDDEIRRRGLEIYPEIALEGGEPSRLPLVVRKKILSDIVERIVSNDDDRSARDNSAIARIADPDLAEDTQQLINKYSKNDDAIFFLGRLVWQGEMSNCVTSLIAIAADSSRGTYARIASARAVMTCGREAQKHDLWKKLTKNNSLIPRELLAELVEKASLDNYFIEHLIVSLNKLPTYEPYKSTGLSRALHNSLKRLPIVGDQQIWARLIDGLHGYLNRAPYIERRECRVSKEFAWLLSPATQALEKMIEIRDKTVLGKSAISILLMVPALRFWRGNEFSEHKNNLHALVPRWPELNDALYWASIETTRAAKSKKSSEPLVDDWSVSWLGHFWSFNLESFPRLIEYIRNREKDDDRLVALSTAFRIYAEANRPSHILKRLQDVVAEEPKLQSKLGILLNPPISDLSRKHEAEEKSLDEEKNRDKQARDTWIAGLRANPDRIRNPPNLQHDEITYDQCWLLDELRGSHSGTKRSEYANWQELIPTFGDAVARAYRDFAINLWRRYMPTLQSEGVIRDGHVPYSLIFAMAGLEIEASETADFPQNLSESQIRHALRYITWELNGFPDWLERMHRAFPILVEEAVIKELIWELRNSEMEKPKHYILSSVVYHAPWLHSAITPTILQWIEDNPKHIRPNRYYCLQILVNGGADPAKLATLASQQIAHADDFESISWWFALRVDCNPQNGIPELEQWLSNLDSKTATRAAEIFVTTLMGSRRSNEVVPNIGRYRTAKHLKSLYILIHRHVRAKEDNIRSGGGVYSPDLRDDAQDARNRLFNLLAEIPGKASYTAINELIDEHPDPNYRPWMAKRAYKRAEEDGDLEPWTADQISTFHRLQVVTPATHRQLFDLAILRLHDLKNWLERGNDSPWETWQLANSETAMRTLVAGWLNQQCRGQYTTAQEPELANSQRMDIWLQNTNVRSPLPIELKLLDKGWSGPKLCERLRNQLVGDYLREKSAACGVMLLVSQRLDSEKQWEIDGRLVKLNELANALKRYWQSIASNFPDIQAIDVIMIDLTMRAKVCAS